MRHHVSVSRREVLQAGAGVLFGAAFAGDGTTRSGAEQGGRPVTSQLSSVKALVFDTFGTVVDWRTSITGEVEMLAGEEGAEGGGAAFADAWRAGYAPSMNRVRTGELPWTTLDRLHRMTLDPLLVEFGITGLSEAEIDRSTEAGTASGPGRMPSRG